MLGMTTIDLIKFALRGRGARRRRLDAAGRFLCNGVNAHKSPAHRAPEVRGSRFPLPGQFAEHHPRPLHEPERRPPGTARGKWPRPAVPEAGAPIAWAMGREQVRMEHGSAIDQNDAGEVLSIHPIASVKVKLAVK